jgi:hypothetical protein
VGLELAAALYAEVIRHLVRVPDAAALLGEGSEVLGYDDARSQDHAWGSRLIIFVDHDEVGLVRRAVDAGLPETFHGHQVRFYAWQSRTVRHHVEVVTVADWLREQLGALPDELQPAHWLGLPQQRLLQVTAGAVFHDDTGQLSEARRALAWYPRDVWLWLMASQWRIIADQEPLPGRTNEAGDQRGTRLALASLARSAMQMCFLQERCYWPYTKWFSMAFSELDAAQSLATDLDQLLGSDDSAQGIAALVTVLEHLAGRHNNLQIGRALDPNCRPFETSSGCSLARVPWDSILDGPPSGRASDLSGEVQGNECLLPSRATWLSYLGDDFEAFVQRSSTRGCSHCPVSHTGRRCAAGAGKFHVHGIGMRVSRASRGERQIQTNSARE